MKVKIVGMSSNMQNEGQKILQHSLDKGGFDYDLFHAVTAWGQQQPTMLQYIKSGKLDGYTHFFYCDCWDIVMMGPFQELLSKLPEVEFLGSVEKCYFPHKPETQQRYPETPFAWRYINGGNWFAEIERYVKWHEEVTSLNVNDQTWLHERFLDSLERGHNVKLDYNCEVFQSIAFEDEKDFACTRNGRILNRVTGTLPISLHFNGRTNGNWVYRTYHEGTMVSLSETMQNILKISTAQIH